MGAFRAVVDSSVAVKLFVPEALSSQAHAVFARLSGSDGAELIVPDLFYIECANVFWKWVHRFQYPTLRAQQHMEDLRGFVLRVIPVRVLAAQALKLALDVGVTAYDSCYVAAAAETRAPLITADQKLVSKFTGSSYNVRWLGDQEAAPPSRTTGATG